MKLALFDLDHTLLPIDSDQSWGHFTTTLGWTDAAEFTRKNDAFYAHYQAGTLDIHDYVRFATEAFAYVPGPKPKPPMPALCAKSYNPLFVLKHWLLLETSTVLLASNFSSSLPPMNL